jgi:hypothetical protein
MAWKKLEKVIDAADTAEQFTTDSIPCSQFIVQVKSSNSAAVQIAPETFATGEGYELVAPSPGAQLPERHIESKEGHNNLNLLHWYVMGGQGQGINIFYEEF